MGLYPGSFVGSNVRLIRPLSRGGMGSVWRAEHTTLKTEVAVKFVSDALIGDAAFLSRFTREAVASARIKSPHAVQIFDHGVTSDGLPYIVMELLEGEDLRARLLREGKLSLALAAKIVAQAARGLSKAHAAGVVHRDIKPGNLFLVDQDGDVFVKLLDFGIAKQMDDLESAVTMTGQIIGTPHYVSPEQIERPREADPQNDLWSLAVVAYRCLTGELPFEGESVGAVAIAIDKAAFAPVTAREPSLPRTLDAWFNKAFTRAPAGRFSSAKAMAAAFEAAARGEPLPADMPDSAILSIRDAAPPAAVSSPGDRREPAPEATPAPETKRDQDGPAARPEERATRPDAPPPAAAAQSATDTPRKADTPLTMGEPTLSQGTVSQIDATHAGRTRLYGGVLAAVAIGGAIAIALLSRGEDPGGGAGSAAPSASAVAAAGTTGAATSAASAGGSARSEPTSTASATATSAAGAAPSVTNSPTFRPNTASVSPGAPAKKKKDRGF